MAKIYERLLSTNILREKMRESFDPQRENLLGEDSMVNLLETPRVIVFFFYYMLAFHSVSHVLDRDKTRSERLLSTNILREKRRDSFDPQRENLLGEDSICMVNLLGTPQVIVFFYYMIDLVWLFQKRSFVLSSEHENQNVATIGTLLDQFMLSCK